MSEFGKFCVFIGEKFNLILKVLVARFLAQNLIGKRINFKTTAPFFRLKMNATLKIDAILKKTPHRKQVDATVKMTALLKQINDNFGTFKF